MKLTIDRKTLLKPLQQISGIVERRQTLPMLSNALLTAEQTTLTITATDLEIELTVALDLIVDEPGQATLPAKKLLDICRTLPDEAQLTLSVDADGRAVVRSGKSRFNLTTLPGESFPKIESVLGDLQLTVSKKLFKKLIERTHFAMAQQDVRYYLNGLLLEFTATGINAVATDGHRLALCQIESEGAMVTEPQQVILPRKGILELLRLFEEADHDLQIEIGKNHIRVSWPNLVFTSKLIDGRFPDYQRVFPLNPNKHVIANKQVLRQALIRMAILSNEKFRGIRFDIKTGLICLSAHNTEQEEAEEEIEVEYEGEAISIGFNATYLLETISIIPTEQLALHLTGANSSCLIVAIGEVGCKYVMMPMML